MVELFVVFARLNRKYDIIPVLAYLIFEDFQTKVKEHFGKELKQAEAELGRAQFRLCWSKL